MHVSEGTLAEVARKWGGSQQNRSVSAQTRGYYSTKAVAALLLVDVTTIRRWADAGKLRCFRTPGGHRRFTQSQISDFIQKYQYELA
jgi:excisionase family DNA binding protein